MVLCQGSAQMKTYVCKFNHLYKYIYIFNHLLKHWKNNNKINDGKQKEEINKDKHRN